MHRSAVLGFSGESSPNVVCKLPATCQLAEPCHMTSQRSSGFATHATRRYGWRDNPCEEYPNSCKTCALGLAPTRTLCLRHPRPITSIACCLANVLSTPHYPALASAS